MATDQEGEEQFMGIRGGIRVINNLAVTPPSKGQSGRLAPVITKQELNDTLTKKEYVVNGEAFPFDMEIESLGTYAPGYLEDGTIAKDLGKVNFDHENCKFEGFEVLANGIPVVHIFAGGDWENPMHYFMYWDGQKVRAYIPSKGNTYNTKSRCAFGSEGDFLDWNGYATQAEAQEAGQEFLDKTFTKDAQKFINSTISSPSESMDGKWHFEYQLDIDQLDFDGDLPEMLLDAENRIQVKP